jgi:hypothetical protein
MLQILLLPISELIVLPAPLVFTVLTNTAVLSTARRMEVFRSRIFSGLSAGRQLTHMPEATLK